MADVSDTIIVGGGIGGLATALAIQETGKSVAIFEQAQEFGEIGAGIQLAPNAVEVLDRLDVKEEIVKVAVFPKRLVLKDVQTAEELATLDLGEDFQKKNLVNHTLCCIVLIFTVFYRKHVRNTKKYVFHVLQWYKQVLVLG